MHNNTNTWNQGTVLISGAGLIGLLLAQVLNQYGIPYIIFDRDSGIDSRGQGWGITLHWALADFLEMLPEELKKEVYKCQVMEDFHLRDKGQFLYINAGTGEPVLKIPPSKRLRVRRQQLRKTLTKDVDVKWSCQTTSIEFDPSNESADKRVTVTCKNGKVFTGGIIIGAEGANSITRKASNSEEGALYDLPVRFLGATVDITEAEYKYISENFDPLLFQGTIPLTETFFWFSLLSSPEYNGSEVYQAQVNFSWRVDDKSKEPFESAQDKVKVIEERSKGLNTKLLFLKEKMIDHQNDFLEIRLSDWSPVEWDDKEGTCILVGDAAHAMVMYRGEAGNHGIADAKLLYDLIKENISGTKSWSKCISEYKQKIKDRAQTAVLLSRQACLDAHDWSKINLQSESPLLTMRKKE